MIFNKLSQLFLLIYKSNPSTSSNILSNFLVNLVENVLKSKDFKFKQPANYMTYQEYIMY